jgi:toxin-antitoxin system PIN domain toxin
MPKTYLPDVNVWLALTFDSHVHHPAAKNWFDGLALNETCSFCRITQQGMLRLATNPSVFGRHALTMADAWHHYDAFRADPRVDFTIEPADVEARWRGFTQNQLFSPHVWNDAYLSAFSQAAGFELVTFDQGFKQFSGVNAVILS